MVVKKSGKMVEISGNGIYMILPRTKAGYEFACKELGEVHGLREYFISKVVVRKVLKK